MNYEYATTFNRHCEIFLEPPDVPENHIQLSRPDTGFRSLFLGSRPEQMAGVAFQCYQCYHAIFYFFIFYFLAFFITLYSVLAIKRLLGRFMR